MEGTGTLSEIFRAALAGDARAALATAVIAYSGTVSSRAQALGTV